MINNNTNIDYNKLLNPKFRQTARENPALALEQLNYKVDDGVSVQFVENTKTKYHVTLWEQEYQHQEMLELSAGSGSVSSIGCAASVSTICGTVSCLGTVGSAGSVDVGI